MAWEYIYENIKDSSPNRTVDEIIKRYDILVSEANTIREKDKELIKNLFSDFYNKKLEVGIGFQRAYGAVLSGDYFDLIALPDGSYLFVFADISGHGLPAYTTLVRLRSAITMSINEINNIYCRAGTLDPAFLVKDITKKFTDIMDDANSHDFACVNFTFIYNIDDRFHLKFFNRSMLFPIVIRKYDRSLVAVYNLNMEEKGWKPGKGFLVGSDVKRLLNDSYYETPCCEFVLYEGDSVLFFSDGIIEAYADNDPENEFGQGRIENILIDNINRPPQEVIDILFNAVYAFINTPQNQKDDMTAVLIDFPSVRL